MKGKGSNLFSMKPQFVYEINYKHKDGWLSSETLHSVVW
jgi:hypothetical protein